MVTGRNTRFNAPPELPALCAGIGRAEFTCAAKRKKSNDERGYIEYLRNEEKEKHWKDSPHHEAVEKQYQRGASEGERSV